MSIGDPPQFLGHQVWSPPGALAIPSPRTLPVNLPFSNFGVTVAVLDQYGNLTIKVDQPESAAR